MNFKIINRKLILNIYENLNKLQKNTIKVFIRKV